MINAVLFDMDGLLFDTERVAAEADKLACRQLGVEMHPQLLPQLYGASRSAAQALFIKYYGEGFDYDRFKTLMRQHVEAITQADGGLRPMPGAEALLRWLRQQGIKTAVASSSYEETVRRFLGLAGFTHYFDAVVGGDMVANSKPAPDIFLYAARQLGTPPGQCLVLEDSPNGVRAGAAAGCITVMVPDMLPATDALRALCAAVLGSLDEVPAFVQRHRGAAL